eukprot:755107-Hanusia_phi.AAC.6
MQTSQSTPLHKSTLLKVAKPPQDFSSESPTSPSQLLSSESRTPVPHLFPGSPIHSLQLLPSPALQPSVPPSLQTSQASSPLSSSVFNILAGLLTPGTVHHLNCPPSARRVLTSAVRPLHLPDRLARRSPILQCYRTSGLLLPLRLGTPLVVESLDNAQVSLLQLRAAQRRVGGHEPRPAFVQQPPVRDVKRVQPSSTHEEEASSCALRARHITGPARWKAHYTAPTTSFPCRDDIRSSAYGLRNLVLVKPLCSRNLLYSTLVSPLRAEVEA